MKLRTIEFAKGCEASRLISDSPMGLHRGDYTTTLIFPSTVWIAEHGGTLSMNHNNSRPDAYSARRLSPLYGPLCSSIHTNQTALLCVHQFRHFHDRHAHAKRRGDKGVGKSLLCWSTAMTLEWHCSGNDHAKDKINRPEMFLNSPLAFF